MASVCESRSVQPHTDAATKSWFPLFGLVFTQQQWLSQTFLGPSQSCGHQDPSIGGVEAPFEAGASASSFLQSLIRRPSHQNEHVLGDGGSGLAYSVVILATSKKREIFNKRKLSGRRIKTFGKAGGRLAKTDKTGHQKYIKKYTKIQFLEGRSDLVRLIFPHEDKISRGTRCAVSIL